MTRKISGAVKFRMACIVALWVLLCYIVVSSQPFTLRVLFILAASGIVVFVPLYKKYFKDGKSGR